jgi:hypothetical protein
MANKFGELPVEREIAEEIANTLGRVGRRLKSRHREAWKALAALEGCPESARKKRLEKALSAAMDEAERARYHLIVQREAMGLRDHREVEKKFPLPKMPGRLPAAGDPASLSLFSFGGFLRGRRRKISG